MTIDGEVVCKYPEPILLPEREVGEAETDKEEANAKLSDTDPAL